MKHLKRLIIVLLVLVLGISFIPLKAEGVKIPLVSGKGYVQYGSKKEYAYINAEYVQKDGEFRGVWVSPLVGDIAYYKSKTQYQSEILSVLDNMEYYNLNVLVFHIRIMNDAFYESKYNNWSIYYNSSPDWEALPWIIEECHKRGIEFHAWMNPYRVRNGKHNLTELASEFPSTNLASNPNNLLQGTNSVILNPGIQEVKEWLVKVCMEVVENYDVDAIHFDDYFYDSGVDDSTTRKQYNTENLSLGDFRRKQVDDFIENLSKAIRSYNEKTGRRVQLGISPSGVWRSGDGKVTYDENGNAITNGSYTTTTFIHYDNYLYSDTVKWINEEWIDYILPQCYWAVEHPICPYYDLLTWWNNVAKYKKVNVYSGMALYNYFLSDKYSWSSDYEAYYEIMIANSLENVQGVCFFSYDSYRKAVKDNSIMEGVKKIWSTRALTPEIQYGEKIIPGTIEGLEIASNKQGNILRWNDADNSKFYVIYRSTEEITYSSTEVLDVVGKNYGSDGKIEYVDETASDQKYYYAVKAQSNSMSLGEGTSITTDEINGEKDAYLGDIVYYLDNLIYEGNQTTFGFEKCSYPFGGEINYSFSYSFDEDAVKTISKFTTQNGINYVTIDIPQGAKELNIELKAYNDIGSTIVNITKNITNNISKITNFGIIDYSYAGVYGTFVFNYHPIEDEGKSVKYTIEYSDNGFAWTDYVDVIGKAKGLNYRFKTKISDKVGTQYYRVRISSDELTAYSDVISINAPSKSLTITGLKVNGEEIKDVYEVECFEKMTIEWNVNKIVGESTSDRLMYSYDNENWFALKLYSNLTNNSTDTKYKYSFSVDALTYKVYIKIFSSYGLYGEVESKTIVLEVESIIILYEELCSYLNNETKDFIKGLNLFIN